MPKIYVIDDSPSVCYAIDQMLSPRGFEVVPEFSGRKAMEQAVAVSPDLIICDLVLPDARGLDVCSYLRRQPELRQAPLVVISGIVDDDVREQATKAGADAVLEKPFTADALQDLLIELLFEPEDEEPQTAPPLRALSEAVAERAGGLGLRCCQLLAGEALIASHGTPVSSLTPDEIRALASHPFGLDEHALASEPTSLTVQSPALTLLVEPIDAAFAVAAVAEAAVPIGLARQRVVQLVAELREVLRADTSSEVSP